jgi:hypothetical protein
MKENNNPEISYENMDSYMLDAVTISNTYNYSIVNDMSYIFESLMDYNIGRNDIKNLVIILYDMLKDINQKDYDLQYRQSIVMSNSIIPPKAMDTVITYDMLRESETLNRDKVFDMAFDDRFIGSMVHSLQQTTVNSIKFQLKYCINSLTKLFEDELVWSMYKVK